MSYRQVALCYLVLAAVFAPIVACVREPDSPRAAPPADPRGRDASSRVNIHDKPDLPTPQGMVWIPGGRFDMGSDDSGARPNEHPVHVVSLTGFYMDVTEVTNAQFAEFVAATGYVTTAERVPDRAAIVAQMPPGASPPDESMLVPGALVFRMTAVPVSTTQPGDYEQWWIWTPGTSWRHPTGPTSTLDGLDDHPVVQVSWDDAQAYCEWAGKQLPTEAQWEYAARGGLDQKPFVWGDEPPSDRDANIWQGQFPFRNSASDGYAATAPVASYPPNGFGLYDMAGNVWEWCSDWFREDWYQILSVEAQFDPAGPPSTDHPRDPRKVQRGGSFLCHRDYCSSYRPSARVGTSTDTGLSHSGFRAVMSETAWRTKRDEGDSKRS